MDIEGYETDWTDPRTGQNFPVAWIVPKPIFYAINGYTSCMANIYVNHQAYLNNFDPMVQINTVANYDSEDWNTYFETSVLQEAGKDYLSQWYAYLKTIYPENP